MDNQLLKELNSEIIGFTTNEFFKGVEENYIQKENECFTLNKDNSIDFVNCMMKFQKKQMKNERIMEFKLNYMKNRLAECLNKNNKEECKAQAISQIKQIQNEFLNL